MCVIIVKPKGKKLTVNEIEKAWDRNPDGGGIVYRDNNRYIVFKTLDKDRYLKYFKKHYREDLNILMHMRIKTHGDISIKNTHPFKTRNAGYFAHNGIITPEGSNKDKLDTLEFRDNIINNLFDRWWENKAIVKMMSEYVGYSKLAFLLPTDEFLFINEDKGDWIDGVWYSNRTFTYTAKPVVKERTYYKGSENNQTNFISSWKETNTSIDILKKALSGDTEKYIDLTRIFKNNGGKVCQFCGAPLITEDEIDNGLCNTCFEEMSNIVEGY